MKSLYIDMSNSGISGDMLLSSLLGFNSDPTRILKELEKLKDTLDGVSKIDLNLGTIERGGIEVSQLEIEIKEDKTHRTADVLKSALNQYLKLTKYSLLAEQYAIDVLDSLIKAEAEVHGTNIQNIHLHELSSVDTLIDILGVTKVLDELGVFNKDFQVYCSQIPLGGGTINTAHGILPVPAPATVKILEKSNLVTFGGPIESELVTPTGAALLTNLNPLYKQFHHQIRLEKVSYSTGQKSFDNFLNIIRVFYGDSENLETNFDKFAEDIAVLETNVDDVSGEILGNFIDSLSQEGVLDIQVLPSITKKNRPSHVVQVYCHPRYSFEIIEKIIYELGTLGVRYNLSKRVCVDRKFEESSIEINNKKYQVKFKISYLHQEEKIKIVNIKPEYEELKKISRDSGLSVNQVLFYCQPEIAKLFAKYNSN